MAHDLKDIIEEYLYKDGEFSPLSYSASYIVKHLNLEDFGLQAFTSDKEGIKLYKVFVHFCLCICVDAHNYKREYIDRYVNKELWDKKNSTQDILNILIPQFKRDLRAKKFPKTDTKGYLREPLMNLYGYMNDSGYSRTEQIHLVLNTYKTLKMFYSSEAIRKERERALKRYSAL